MSVRRKEGFKLEKKIYGKKYLLLLPFQCCPFGTAGTLAQKLITGIVCTLWIVVEAGMIDGALACMEGRAEWRKLLPFLFLFLLMVIWKRMGYNLGRLLTMWGESKAGYLFQNEVVKKCSRVSYRILEDVRFQELKYAIWDKAEQIIWTMIQQTGNFIQYMVRVMGICLLLGLESPWLGGLVFAFLIPFVYVSIQSKRRIGQEFQSKKRIGLRWRAYLDGVLRHRLAVEERSIFSYTDYVQKRRDEQEEGFAKVLYQRFRNILKGEISGIIQLSILFFLILLFRISLLAKGVISLGMFISLSRGVYDMVVFLYNGVDDTIQMMECGMEFLGDITTFAAMPEIEGTNELPAENAEEFESLEIRKVSFCYPRTTKYILKDLSLTLKKGRHYAFVGENGTGKTTIAKLLTGVYDSYEGSILINGIELRDYTPERRKAMFAAIYQDSARYEDTVAVNIQIGDARHMDGGERMECVARVAGAYDMIQALPEKFDTLLGKKAGDGTELSAGSWQKVIMARLLMSPAPFYILDEPAVALDPMAESRLYEKFDEISRGKTTLSISHRLGSTKRADRIFVLKDGRVSEEGSHEELMERRGLYAKMYESQKEWYR